MNHRAFSRKGGQARSPAKTAANRAKAKAYWAAVRAGEVPGPRRSKAPPPSPVIASLLEAYCREVGISQLEVFGSVARGQAKRGSDVDLIATFRENPGLRFFSMEQDMSALLGVPVNLLSRDAVDTMTNPFRRAGILADARVILRE